MSQLMSTLDEVPRRHDVDANEVVRLYVEEGLRGQEIAQKLACSDSVVYERLESAGVKRSREARLDRDEVTQLYIEHRLSAVEIAARVGVSASTIRKHLRKWGVPLRSVLEAQQPRGRRPCPRSAPFRAYVLGFAIGDLCVVRPHERGRTIHAYCSTTRQEQVDLLMELFGPFGRVTFSGGTVRASLDASFSFLLAKYERRMPTWLNRGEDAAAFAAGYIDAEGSFGVYEGRARFKLDSYDDFVLVWLHQWCASVGVEACLRLVGASGARRTDGLSFTNDLWRISVNERMSMLRFVATLEPFLRHKRRVADVERCRSNVIQRLELCARSFAL